MEKIILKKKDCGIHWGERSGPCRKCKNPPRIGYRRDSLALAFLNSCKRVKEDPHYYNNL